MLVAAPRGSAQDYRWEENSEQAVAYMVYKKLAEIPMRFGEEDLHRIQRFEPEDEGDYVYGKFGVAYWYLNVMVFGERGNGGGADGEGPTTGDRPKTREEAAEEARRELIEGRRARTFEQWVTDKDPKRENRKILVDGKVRRGSSTRPESRWWEYVDEYPGNKDMVWFRTACAYNLGDREIVLEVTLPNDPDEKRLASKWRPIVKRICESLKIIEVDEADAVDEKRDEHADTPEKQAQLAKLKENIGDLENWDYFTTPRFIITFSWEPDKPEKRIDSFKFAKEMASNLEDLRELFELEYPPHDQMDENYSVIRVCYNYDEFRSYGDMPYGVAGWFSPGTKELCVFYDDKRELYKNTDEVLGTCIHEAWHQYSDQYWPDVELHRWFDEGLAEYFGSFRKRGSKFRYQYHEDRFTSIKRQLSDGTYIPGHQIVKWDRATFYGPRAADHYAQAWAMMDMIKRGEDVLRGRYDQAWKKILPTYSEICLKEKNPKKAIDAAFEGIDLDAMDAIWIDWVESGKIKK